jgi:hypothetical protein
MLRRDRAIGGSNAELKREGVRRELVQDESLRGTGAPGEIRTPDVLLRRQMLYPAELRARSLDYSAFGGVFVLRLGAELSWLVVGMAPKQGNAENDGKGFNA